MFIPIVDRLYVLDRGKIAGVYNKQDIRYGRTN